MPRATHAADVERQTLYLIRHAIAADRGEKHPNDDLRPLSRKGIDRMRQIVRGFATLDPRVDLVLTSPLVRARRTAEIVLASLSPTPGLENCDALAPGHTPADVATTLSRHTTRKVVALVGHEPDLGLLAAWLLGSREPIPFKKGGIARIDAGTPVAARGGQLVWCATPRMLRQLRD
jgi:phosphohistidine phosphatase